MILAMGMDALGMEESKKNFRTEIEDIVDRVRGRYVVVGNLDAVGVLQNGSEERLRAEIGRQVAAGRRNESRFIMSLGSPVTPDTPVERVQLYCDLAHELGGRD
jgi:uroporphyrinogen-III decarboxylase